MDELALRQGCAALRELHGDATVAPIRNYADYTRAAVHRLAADVRAALAEQRSADAKQAARTSLQGCARALAERNLPLRWTTPLGMQIQQAYFNLTHSQVVTLYGRASLWAADEDGVGWSALTCPPI